MKASLLFVGALLCLVVADLVTVEQEAIIKKPGWTLVGAAPQDKILKLTFALKLKDTAAIEKLFWEVSDPTSKSYGNYLSFEDFKKQFAPEEETVQKIVAWLKSNGATEVTVHESNEFITATISVLDAETLLSTRYSVYTHIATGKTFTKAQSKYSLPSEMAALIDYVSGFRFPNWKRKDVPKEPIGEHRLKNSLSGPAPIQVYVNPLDSLSTNVVLPVCENGNITTSFPLCGEYDWNSNITSINVYPIINGQYASDKVVNFVPTSDKCRPCVNQTGHGAASCTAANIYYNLPPETMYCEITVPGLLNYEATDFMYYIYYASGNTSLGIGNHTFYLSPFTTPQSLKRLYNIPLSYYANNTANSQSVAEFLGQYFSFSDLNLFFQAFGLVNQTGMVNVIGPNDESNPGGEAELDIQYLMGVAGNISTVFWSLPGLHDGQEPFLTWIMDVLNTVNPPLVHSVSYGDDENSLTMSYMSSVNTQFQKAALRGLTLLFAAGDNGVFSGNPVNPYTSCGYTSTPSFPPTSPYVTSVGATMMSMRNLPICNYFSSIYAPANIPCHEQGEIVSSTATGSRITTGGGFSNVFSRPAYQDSFVQGYLSQIGNLPSSFYNPLGRAYPDVASIGHNYMVFINGQIEPVDGTSASTPVVAGVLALLNDIRLNTGLPQLGFVNPLLYTLAAQISPSPFNDVTIGDNSCSELYWVCCPFGFPAKPGFDAVSGLGTLDFGKLSVLVQQYIGNHQKTQ